MFIILNSAYRPQKIIPNQINTTAVMLENEKTPGDEVAWQAFERGGKGAFGREREARGTRPSCFSRARNSLSLPFQTPTTHATFLSVMGSAFGRCRFLSAGIYFLVPCALLWGKKISFRQATIVYCWPLCESFNKETFFRVDERFRILSSRGGCCV